MDKIHGKFTLQCMVGFIKDRMDQKYIFNPRSQLNHKLLVPTKNEYRYFNLIILIHFVWHN